MCFNLKNCCCFDLKTGSLIIGILDIVTGIMGMCQLIVHHNPDVAMGIIQKIGSVLGIVAAVLLVIGIRRGMSRFLLFWFIVKIIGLTCLALIFITVLVGLIASSEENMKYELKIVLITTEVVLVATFILQIYFLMVVQSYRKEMKSYANSSTA